jgi:flagellar biosynthetic protein FliR
VSILFGELLTLLLVFVRMSGIMLTNPLFTRSNIPMQLRMTIIFALSLLLSTAMDGVAISELSSVEYVMAVFREILTGITIGMVFQLFYYLLIGAGDIIDFNIGLSMSKVFDPGSNIQMSVSGSFLTAFFVLYIFASDSHLELIRVFASTYKIVPLGAAELKPELYLFIVDLFTGLFSLVLRLAIPFIVAHISLEAALGILMKIVPQIHVFVLNIQMKLILGLCLMFLFAAPIAGFVDNCMSILFSSYSNALNVIAPSDLS